MLIKPIKQTDMSIKPIRKGDMQIKPISVINSNTTFGAMIKPLSSNKGFNTALIFRKDNRKVFIA